MEQKKTLWIIAAVGTFLLVVLGTAGILYSPSKNSANEIAKVTTSTTEKDKNNGWKTTTSEENSENPIAIENNTTPQRVEEMVVVSNNTTVYDLNKKNAEENTTTIDLNALKSELNPPAETEQVPDQNADVTKDINKNDAENTIKNVNETINKNTNKSVKIPDEEEKKFVKSDTSDYKPVPVAKNADNKAPAKKQPKKEEKPVPAPKQVTPKKVTQYWVQVASFSNKKGAENAKLILDNNKISSDIFTFEDSKSNLYYRVRIGPYTTKSEAEYWKSRVLSIDYFKNNDSYITSTVK